MKTIKYNGINFQIDGMDIYHKGKLLKPVLNKKMNRYYVTVYLGKGDKHTQKYRNKNGYVYITIARYRLIAAAMVDDFKYEQYKNMQVDHIDSCSTNDQPENLRWVSRKFNNSTAHSRQMRSMNHNCTNHEMDIVRATKDGETRYFKNGYKCAQQLKCSHVLVYNCLNPNHFAKTAKGWKLEWMPLAKLAGGKEKKMPDATDSDLLKIFNM